MKRNLGIVLILAVVAAAVFFVFRPTPAQPEQGGKSASSTSHSDTPQGSSVIPKTPAPVELERLDLAKELNDPGKTIQQDLHLLDTVFLAWQSNFLKDGNPVGENAEITAALTGTNKFHVAFLSPQHPAINARGELCDRWGSPFVFHQLSGAKMEIRSLGPDRVRGSSDDVVFTP